MSQPTPYVPAHAFVSDSATVPNFPGQALDVEFQDVKTTTDQIRTNLAKIQRDDGALANASVTFDSLSPDLQALGTIPVSHPIALTGTGTAIVPGVVIDVTDDVAVAASMTDSHGNFTPEGWFNVSALNVNWTSGSAGLAQGARTPLLSNLFFKYPSSPSNTGPFYSSAIFTSNIYTDDHGTAGAPQGFAYGLATVSYLKSTVKHWHAIFGYEADMTVEAGASVDYKIGVASFLSNNDAVQGNVIDAAFYVTAQTTNPGWRNAFLVHNLDGTNPMSADGILLGTKGAVTMTHAVDVASATITGNILNSAPLTITGQGAYKVTTGVLTNDVAAITLLSGTAGQHVYQAMGRVAGVSGIDLVFGVAGTTNDFLTGSVAGDAIINYSGNLLLGHNLSTPHAEITTAGQLKVQPSTAIPAGGAATVGFAASSTANFGVFFGSGAPTMSAAKGSLYLRSDGSSTSTRMYVNTDGSTTWTNVVTAA